MILLEIDVNGAGNELTTSTEARLESLWQVADSS